MNRRIVLPLAAAALVSTLVAGCTSGPTVARGQNPTSDPFVTPVSYGTQPAILDAVSDHKHGTQITHYQYDQAYCPSGDCRNGGYCPPQTGCPTCKGHGLQGALCPTCQRDNCNLQSQYPRHNLTYSYQRPNDLRYPDPNTPAGMVVYPFYTLKGPRDFFSQ